MRISHRTESLPPSRAVLLTLLLVGALRAAPGAAAQEGVTLYRDPGFEGPHQTFTLDVPDLGLADDSASSLRIADGCRVTLYRDAEFLGTAFSVASDVPDLGETPIGDDSLSSLKIDCDAPRRPERSDRSDRPERARPPERPLPPERPDRPDRGEGVRIYEHRDFQGDSELFAGPDDDLGDNPFGDDVASSVLVAKGCRAILYQDSQFQGTSVTITKSASDLGSTPIGDDSLSSLQVVCQRPHRPPIRTRLFRGDGVLLYDNQNFLGRYELFTADDPDLEDNAIGNDTASSVRVAAGCRAVLYREPNFQGASYTVVADTAELMGTPMGDDAVSSIEVTCRGGRSED